MTYSLEDLYTFAGPVRQCAYCGDHADTVDHTVPRWFVAENTAYLRRFRLTKVAACRECNQFAADIIDKTWADRKRRIAKRLRKRYAKLLQTASWTPEEIDELGPTLRLVVGQSDAAATQLRRRLRVLDDLFWPDDVPQELGDRRERLSAWGEELDDPDC